MTLNTEFTEHLLMLWLVLCHFLHLDGNSFCWLETHSVTCSVRHIIIAFLWWWPAVWQPKQSKQETKYSRQRQTYVHTNKHAFVILFCLFFMSHSVSLVSLREVESASHEHQDYTHPENLPVHPTTSICSDLWCWPGPQSLPLAVGTVGNTHLPVWLCGCYVSPVLAHTPTHTQTCTNTHTLI